jgi:hypothetical protein
MARPMPRLAPVMMATRFSMTAPSVPRIAAAESYRNGEASIVVAGGRGTRASELRSRSQALNKRTTRLMAGCSIVRSFLLAPKAAAAAAAAHTSL